MNLWRRMMMGGNTSVENGIKIGSNENPLSFEAMFYALENGTGATGTLLFETALPNTEILLFSSGLDEIHGLMFLAEGFPQVFNEVNSTQTCGLTLTTYENGILKKGRHLYRTDQMFKISTDETANGGGSVMHGSIRIDAGDVYCKANYNKNANFTPFEPGIKYRWVAW